MQSQFFVTWHEARGDTKIQHTEWQKHAVGFVRELSFITPLKASASSAPVALLTSPVVGVPDESCCA